MDIPNLNKIKALRAASASPKLRSKFGAVRSGGYDSRKEHRRAGQRKLMLFLHGISIKES